ncbi:MAG: xynZ [Solirubrobacterales bacterium]|nr:xynZ [Solirubrobacterales bacterium]
MRRRLLLLVVLLLAALVVVAVVRRHEAAGPIPVPANVRSPPRLTRPLGAALDADHARHDPVYLRDFLSTFTSLTPENAMKWAVVEPSRGHFDFGDADALVDFAQRTRRRVRGHTLVWDEQLPGWLADHTWSPADLTKALATHIQTVVARYQGRVESWDVVNEPLDDDGSLTRDVFLRTLGPGYIDLAFRLAHAADPHARLFLNEIAAESPSPKQDALVALVRGLKQRGVPIDGVGLQDHTDAGDYPSQATLERVMRRFTALGLDVEITELDVQVNRGRHVADPLRAQADGYAAAGSACAATPRCTGVTVWGVTDKWSWKQPAGAATLFDVDGRPKPARDALLRALGG